MFIRELDKDGVLNLNPGMPIWHEQLFTAEDLVHIFTMIGGFWAYDYLAADRGCPGLHAELKSKRHSNGFFNAKQVLCYPNILEIMAKQLAAKWAKSHMAPPELVTGVPTGAMKLAELVAEHLKADVVEMVKKDGRMELKSNLSPGKSLLLVEDFTTRGTGFSEAVRDILSRQPRANILSFVLVILNRGGLKKIDLDGVGSFEILPLVTHRIEDWLPEKCPLCQMGSKPIKPKEEPENWEMLIKSQL